MLVAMRTSVLEKVKLMEIYQKILKGTQGIKDMEAIREEQEERIKSASKTLIWMQVTGRVMAWNKRPTQLYMFSPELPRESRNIVTW